MNQRDVELRLGLEPVEELLATRAELVSKVADLRARHGSFGTFDPMRKQQLAQIGAKLRAQAVLDGVKVTEAAIEEKSHASEEYAAFITQMTEEKTRWATLENDVQAIEDRIRRGNAIITYLSAEARL